MAEFYSARGWEIPPLPWTNLSPPFSLPPVQRDRPWSMEDLVARLRGRYSTRPHPMNVGQALRTLGWTQRRDWTREGGGRRYWYQREDKATAHIP